MISLLTPTRKRPERLREMILSVAATAKVLPEILCYVSDCDSSYDGQDFSPARIVRGPRVIMSSLWNEIIPHAKGDIFMLCADDVLFRTLDWDRVVENAFAACPDKILLCFGDDLGPAGKSFATLPFVHRRWYETLGYFTGPGFSADYSDTWPNDVAEMLKRKKLLPIVTEHAHWMWGKAEKDEVYRENEQRLIRDQCAKQYAARLPERLHDAEKLRKLIGTPWP